MDIGHSCSRPTLKPGHAPYPERWVAYVPMEIEIIAIGLTAIYGVTIAILIFSYLLHRNIFTQKILYLNEELRTLDERVNFSIPKYKRFVPKREAEEQYPPKIRTEYFDNFSYKSLVERFNLRISIRDKLIKRFSIIFGILLFIVGLTSLYL